ncbi:hypothetical protein COO91_09699 (plasmid) [Nostoc flagelliforme CCNUN1]|uniref:Uncharacterized protein n=1 Tax=Nostoc flagelliforme CCNUN1 TaxID=2038116 RepID=A0A2K8T743_9NOSO|nr:hypothetical protein [Nostoc flagelliforme]AUB43518.1 hypothetical protein COO91_09699 [Nostoc flagelliforme CCNUN1]
MGISHESLVIGHRSLVIGHWSSRAIAESLKIKTFTTKANSTLRGKDMQLGYFQKDALIEKLAKKFYAILGYVVPESYRMQSATHPAERACVAMAIFAVEEFELILAEFELEQLKEEKY